VVVMRLDPELAQRVFAAQFSAFHNRVSTVVRLKSAGAADAQRRPPAALSR